ncbi:hypothetical protein O6H91_09G019800 [Diphasiastrum complanatum]|uniref:Uncharacterized protein n=2 Tax=Diphasiastrum complanatum TaxID=34168 RepID=A0ACC2CMN2_DIPCM|nr:hypothetical protein O6H91_09G019600 [Diphasiastrum complanatum]KAJ7542959.1 hypothetical protein O6H91_09G019800 [Diphasiastrum complanatum]
MRRLFCAAVLVAVLYSIKVGSIELRGLDARFDQCQHATSKDCQDAVGKVCKWCDQPEKCYPSDFARSLGILCSGQQLRHATEVKECEDVAFRNQCLSMDRCRWCKSEVLDDACFSLSEARKLPVQVFSCAQAS